MYNIKPSAAVVQVQDLNRTTSKEQVKKTDLVMVVMKEMEIRRKILMKVMTKGKGLKIARRVVVIR